MGHGRLTTRWSRPGQPGVWPWRDTSLGLAKRLSSRPLGGYNRQRRENNEADVDLCPINYSVVIGLRARANNDVPRTDSVANSDTLQTDSDANSDTQSNTYATPSRSKPHRLYHQVVEYPTRHTEARPGSPGPIAQVPDL